MAYPYVDKKILVIKANWYLLTLNQNRTHSVTVCFNKHFRKRVLKIWSLSPIASCNLVAIIKWGGWQEVQFLQAPPILSRIRLAAMPPGLGPGFRRFESFMRDQV